MDTFWKRIRLVKIVKLSSFIRVREVKMFKLGLGYCKFRLSLSVVSVKKKNKSRLG